MNINPRAAGIKTVDLRTSDSIKPVARGFFSDEPNTIDNVAESSKFVAVAVIVVAVAALLLWYVPRSASPFVK